MVGFGADGAANMVGRRTQLKENYLHIVIVHGIAWLAHRIELAYRDSMTDSKLYMKMQMLMQGLYAYYRK